MVIDALHTRRILRGDDDGRALALVGDRPPQFHHAVPDDDVDECRRRPRLTCQFGDDPVVDGLVAGRSRFDLAGEPGKRVNEIGAADDADDRGSAHHRQALDAPLLHQSHDLVERSVLGDGQRAECHDLVDLAPMGAGVFIRKPAGSHQVFQPARSPALGPGFGPPEKIAFRYDADRARRSFRSRANR